MLPINLTPRTNQKIAKKLLANFSNTNADFFDTKFAEKLKSITQPIDLGNKTFYHGSSSLKGLMLSKLGFDETVPPMKIISNILARKKMFYRELGTATYLTPSKKVAQSYGWSVCDAKLDCKNSVLIKSKDWADLYSNFILPKINDFFTNGALSNKLAERKGLKQQFSDELVKQIFVKNKIDAACLDDSIIFILDKSRKNTNIFNEKLQQIAVFNPSNIKPTKKNVPEAIDDAIIGKGRRFKYILRRLSEKFCNKLSK